MRYNRSIQLPDTYYWIDEYGLVRNNDPAGNYGIGDSIGRTFYTFLTYYDPMLVFAIQDLWTFEGKKLRGRRHPLKQENDKMSRDHFYYSLSAFALYIRRFGEGTSVRASIKNLAHAVPFRITSMARMTLSLVLWAKAVAGSKLALWAYYHVDYLTCLLLYRPVWWIGTRLGGFGEEITQSAWEEYGPMHLKKKKKWIAKMIFPSYALLFSGVSLYVLDDKIFPHLHARLLRTYLPMVGKTNYVQRIFFGDTLSPEDKKDIALYKPMTKMRWSGYLNWANDRDIRVLKTEYSYNNLDRDMLDRLMYGNFPGHSRFER